MEIRQLNHGQAYILGSIAKWSDHYRRAMTSLNTSVQDGIAYGPRRGIDIDAANKASFASKLVEELLDQAYEMFENITSEELSQITGMAMKPTEFGTRRRYNEGDEY
jgi:hypothetical protein